MTDAQKVTLSKLVREPLDKVKSALDSLARRYTSAELAAIESELLDILAEYTPVANKHLIVEGGRDGVNLNYGRNRGDLRAQARKLLEMPDALDSADASAVRVVALRGAGGV